MRQIYKYRNCLQLNYKAYHIIWLPTKQAVWTTCVRCGGLCVLSNNIHNPLDVAVYVYHNYVNYYIHNPEGV